MSAAQQWLNLAIAAGSFVALLAALYLAVRRWVRRVATDTRQVREQLETSNGTTIGGYVEQSAERLERIEGVIGALVDGHSANRDLATRALDRAAHAHERLDDHLRKIGVKE